MKRINILPGLLAIVCITGCNKKINNDPDIIQANLELSLKDAAPFPLGVGVDYDAFMANGNYTALVKSQFNTATAGYVMKHGAIVQGNGSYNFTRADAFVNAVTAAGMNVYGHTLCWYQNNNGNYLRNLVTVPPNPNLVTDGSFEVAGSGSPFASWSVYNGSTMVSAGSGANETFAGSRSLKAAPVTAGNPWSVQVASSAMALTVGVGYKVRFYAKAATAGGKFRLSNSGGSLAQYSGDYPITTSWAPYEWTFTTNEASKRILFDMGSSANTYYVDSVTVSLAAVTNFSEIQYRVDTTLKNFITGMVTRYKDKVHAWDVVNEPFDDNGVVRSGTSASDAFYWGDYLGDRDANKKMLTNGDSMIAKAFRYAHAADPTAKLFLNDYAHETNNVKMDSLISLVTRLKARGVPIDGVGLQMHMSYLVANTAIDNALMKMTRLGLLVKITELDISVNLGDQNNPQTANFVLSPTMLPQQAAKYKYVAESYLRNVPEAQRYGITVWGVGDADSWLRNRTPYHTKDYPLLWDESYNKKEAYTAFLTGLQLK
ncbi:MULTISPECIES: endo-1,4-beta-xylanase [Niastella]|uniref:Beta-xylanase n=1 Tax=Niastella soli TaxID=2821487 RepID=A0ABS3Z4Y2_9BACT|nr:endo-1,4-beta-xylanase [Niastella soli]MBO9205222.1 endo-1,4-beta-xylanase [Niastella soli]